MHPTDTALLKKMGSFYVRVRKKTWKRRPARTLLTIDLGYCNHGSNVGYNNYDNKKICSSILGYRNCMVHVISYNIG